MCGIDEHDPIAPYDGALPHLNGEGIDPEFRRFNLRRKNSGRRAYWLGVFFRLCQLVAARVAFAWESWRKRSEPAALAKT